MMNRFDFDKFPFGPKSAWEDNAQAIVNGRMSLSDAEIPPLLGWLRDYNWPGASTIAEYLLEVPPIKLVSAVSMILGGDDEEWSYWLLVLIVRKWPQRSILPLYKQLLKIAGGSNSTLVEIARQLLSELDESDNSQ